MSRPNITGAATQPVLQPGEDLFGFLLRYVQAKKLERLNDLARIAGSALPWTPVRLKQVLPRLSQLTGVSEAELEDAGLFPVRSANQASVKGWNGQLISYPSVTHRTARVCPACLAENGMARLIWRLAAYTECSRHAIQMVEQCWNCSNPISWSRRRLGLCGRCHRDLSKAPHVPSEPTALAIALDVERRADRAGPVTIFPGRTEVADLQPFLNLVLRLGCFLRGLDRGWRLSCGHSVEEFRRTITAAGGILCSDWPKAFHADLRRRIIRPWRLADSDLYAAFPRLYGGLRLYPELKPVLDEFDRYMFREEREIVSHISRTSSFWRRQGRWRDTKSITEAAEALHTTGDVFLQLVRDLKIDLMAVKEGQKSIHRHIRFNDFVRVAAALTRERWRKQVGAGDGLVPVVKRNGTVLIHPRELQNLAKGRPFPSVDLDAHEHADLYVSYRILSKRLGLTEEATSRLVRADFFRRYHSERSAAHSIGVPLAGWCRFEARVSEMFGERPVGRLTDEFIGVGEVIRRFRTYGLEYAGLLQAVFDGTIAPGGLLPEVQGLRRLMLARSDVERLVSAKRKSLFGELLESDEVCRRLGLVSRRVLAHLESKQLITGRNIDGCPGGACGYDAAECERFENEYISLITIQAALGGSRRSLRKTFAAAGARPAIGPEVDGCWQTFYRREDLRKLLPDSLFMRHPADQNPRPGNTWAPSGVTGSWHSSAQ